MIWLPVKDSVVQRWFNLPANPLAMPTPSRNFEGLANDWGFYPPDTNGEAGPHHYVQIVNAYVALGKLEEATRANGRAMELLRRMPAGSFDEHDQMMNRESWEKWLSWSGTVWN